MDEEKPQGAQSDEASEGGASASRRRMRRYISPLPRYAIIASWGMLLAVATFYLLRKLGY